MWDDILLFVAIGFAAQIIDGAIGMAYGVTSTSVLLSFGVPPATASACVHAAETFTTGASGAAHWRMGNIDRGLVWRIAVPGMIGGAIGAYILTNLPGDAVRPFINAYLLLLGIFILWKALVTTPRTGPPPRAVAPLGFFGGLLELDRRGRLGADRHLDAARAGGHAALCDRVGQSRGVLRYRDHLGHLPGNDRSRSVADHCRAHHRRSAGGAVRGGGHQALARPGADGAGRLRRGDPQRARDRDGAGVGWRRECAST